MIVPRHSFAALAVLVCTAPAAIAAPATLTLQAGEQKTWSIGQPIMRVATANADVVGINAVAPNGVIITAKKPGEVMVSIWAQGRSDAPVSQYRVRVLPSVAAARQALGRDAGTVQLTAEGAQLRLSGSLSSLEQHANVSAAAIEPGSGDKKPETALIDASTSNFDVQVRMDIKIVEVSRQKLQEAGFYYQRLRYRNGQYHGSTGISNPDNYQGFERDSDGNTMFKSATGTVPFLDAFNIFAVSNNVWATFSALESNGFAYSLAEPSLTSLSGQTATFLAGGEIPVPFRSGADGAISIQFKEFGIRLRLTPTVLDQNRMTIRVSPEVSEVDPSLSIQTGGYTIPGLRVRRTDTTVAIGDGETFVISGLINAQNTAVVNKFPFLGDLPIIGAFFKSSRLQREDKELLMLATPHLVRPFAKTATLPALPGEDARRYDPSFMHMFLKETGRFDPPDSGFSR